MKKLTELMAEELSAAFEKAGYDPAYGKSKQYPTVRIFANISVTVQWLARRHTKKHHLSLLTQVADQLKDSKDLFHGGSSKAGIY